MRWEAVGAGQPLALVAILEAGEEAITKLTSLVRARGIRVGHISAVGGFARAMIVDGDQRPALIREQSDVLALDVDVRTDADGPRLFAHAVLLLLDGSVRSGRLVAADVWPSLESVVSAEPAPTVVCRPWSALTGAGRQQLGHELLPTVVRPSWGGRTSTQLMVDFARAVVTASDLREARGRVLQLGCEMLDTQWAALTRHGTPTAVQFIANSHEVVRKIAAVATTLREGVSWQLYLERAGVTMPDLDVETRWPNFRRAVNSALPIRSILGLPVQFDDDHDGALIWYSEQARHFDGWRASNAELLACYASTSLSYVAYRTKAEHLEAALRTKREIAAAIGIVSDRHGLSEQEALDLLSKASGISGIKRRDLAAGIVFTGEVPRVVSECAPHRPNE
ncbi:MAG TPA: DUF296 domain-containing protein [Mycobacterium sp.]|jgi:predicted DNA-binding protein with PD1-like motif|nr:DUF296 domain-containing protein [Mycobacterium sp.]